MSRESIERLLNRRPFTPFVVTMSSGQTAVVRHPEFAFMLRSNLVVGEPNTDNVDILPLLHIAGVQTEQVA